MKKGSLFLTSRETSKFYIHWFYRIVCLARHTQSTQNTKLAYLFNISRKKWAMNFFLPPGKYVVSFCIKLVVSFWMCITRLAKSTQNNKFAIYLTTGRMKFIFCSQKNIKHIFEIDTIILSLCGQACPSYLK